MTTMTTMTTRTTPKYKRSHYSTNRERFDETETDIVPDIYEDKTEGGAAAKTTKKTIVPNTHFIAVLQKQGWMKEATAYRNGSKIYRKQNAALVKKLTYAVGLTDISILRNFLRGDEVIERKPRVMKLKTITEEEIDEATGEVKVKIPRTKKVIVPEAHFEAVIIARGWSEEAAAYKNGSVLYRKRHAELVKRLTIAVGLTDISILRNYLRGGECDKMSITLVPKGETQKLEKAEKKQPKKAMKVRFEEEEEMSRAEEIEMYQRRTDEMNETQQKMEAAHQEAVNRKYDAVSDDESEVSDDESEVSEAVSEVIDDDETESEVEAVITPPPAPVLRKITIKRPILIRKAAVAVAKVIDDDETESE